MAQRTLTNEQRSSQTANPGPITITDAKGVPVAPPPPPSPALPNDPTDADVSLFGYRTAFDGLGVIFDTSPTQPLYPRSDRRNWDPSAQTDAHHGLGAGGGVVSGVLDDGSGGKWLEPDGRELKIDDEASYLDKAIGECEGELLGTPNPARPSLTFSTNSQLPSVTPMASSGLASPTSTTPSA